MPPKNPPTLTAKEASSFLSKTYKMVNDPESNELIEWNEEGNGFVVKEEVKFAQTLLPQYFRHKNMSSFVRQLNFYGFRKTRSDKKSFFRHDQFLRNNPASIASIKRKVSESNAGFKDAVESLQNDVADLKAQYNQIATTQQSLLYVLYKYLRWVPDDMKSHIPQPQHIQGQQQHQVKRLRPTNPNNTDSVINPPTPWELVNYLPNGRSILNQDDVPKTISNRPVIDPNNLENAPVLDRCVVNDLKRLNLYENGNTCCDTTKCVSNPTIMYEPGHRQELGRALAVRDSSINQMNNSNLSHNNNPNALYPSSSTSLSTPFHPNTSANPNLYQSNPNQTQHLPWSNAQNTPYAGGSIHNPSSSTTNFDPILSLPSSSSSFSSSSSLPTQPLAPFPENEQDFPSLLYLPPSSQNANTLMLNNDARAPSVSSGMKRSHADMTHHSGSNQWQT